MKILILGSKEYPMGANQGDDPQPSGGIEIYIDSLVKNLSQERSLELLIITRKFKNIEPYKKNGNIEVYRVPWIKGFYFRNISFNLLSFLKALRIDFDIIYANDLFATLFGVVLSKIKKKPLLSLVHGTSFDQPQYNVILRAILKRLEKFTYSRVNYIVSLSDEVKRNFREKLGSLQENWKVIYMGVELERFEKADGFKVREELKLEKDVNVITFTGRLIEVKGVKYLIEAAGKLERGNFVVLIVGSGLEEEKLKKLTNELNIKDRVIFTGFRKDIPDILAATNIYVLPSISEGLSISLLEAKASGCACIVTDIGLPVEHEKNALVIPPANSYALTKAIETLIDDKRLRGKLAKNAKEEVIRKYSWKKAVEEYMKIFTELVKYQT